ncbi:HEXXH motif domain-containing protein [Kibdelosporangium aridum]|uniref:HEXXH motif domain-containing protein n=1 Tax=Kibdelosporangium aridum TaxID=2030 RepID=A0A428YTM2_KIBAR|nr:HEXXH motif domain-containing protein [Kibdelosporangium aridum]RSM72810.1 HEXXH motif domain-containing protein [Kibdelosporangium aridum]
MTEQTITHRLDRSFFQEFHSGPISTASMGVLRASVHSQRRAMLLAVMHSLQAVNADTRDALERSWQILSAAEERDADAVEAILMHPPTGVWLVRALRELLGVSQHHELDYLHSMAAAAAIRAKVACTLTVPVTFGTVCLPTVGSVDAPAGNTAQVHVTPNAALIYFDGVAEPISVTAAGFAARQTHRASARGIDLVVEIDDSNPYREFSDPTPAHRMTQTEWTHWHDLVDDAWDLLTLRHTAYAKELSAGLLTVAPIFSGKDVVGSSSHDAFGGIALSAKVSAATFAEVLVHEMQHSKLNALIDLVQVRREDDDQLWYAPWRDDPRPLTGLLHGIYAFVSVVEFWQVQRNFADASREADYVFAYRRHQVRQAVRALRSSPDLTEISSDLVSGVADRIAACDTETLPDDLVDAVTLIEKDHWVTWRLRHVSPRPADIHRLETLWSAAEPAPALSTTDEIAPFNRVVTGSARGTLLKTKVIDRHKFDQIVHSGVNSADIMFAVGDYAGAQAAYVDRINASAADTDAWAGLAVSLTPGTSAARAMSTTPEILLDLHNHLRAGGDAPDPVELATWLGT